MLSKCIAVLKEKMKREVWNDFDRILDRGGKAYKLCMMGDLNGSVGKEREWICVLSLEFQLKIRIEGAILFCAES